MCGRLVEAISGVPFADYMREVIFEPLGMDSTSFTLDAETEAPQLCTLCAPILHDVIAVGGCEEWSDGCLLRSLADNPKFELSKAPSEMPPGGMMALTMDPENLPIVERMFDGLEPSPDGPLSSTFLEGEVACESTERPYYGW